MKISRQLQTIGIAMGLGLFVATGLFMTIAANITQPQQAYASGPIPPSVTAPAEQLGNAFAAVASHVKPAVVSVYSEKMVSYQAPESDFPFGDDFFKQFFGGQVPFHHPHGQRREYKVPEHGMGTGMLLDKEGHILTNYHVVQDVDQIRVQLSDKRSFPASIVGADPKTDVAVLELQGFFLGNLPTIQLGDSDAIEDGNLVMAIGAPFGLTQTVTTGIISAKGRSDVGVADYEDFLQTDAPINPGNSGGPLINMRGEVIGMNSAIETSVGQFSGVGFAIPSNMIKAMLPTLIKGGKITRGMIGVSIQEVTKELADQFHLPSAKGALVAQVFKDSPAEKAGLKAGDVIVKINGQDVSDTGQLRNAIASSAPGSQATIVAVRDGKEKTFTVTIGKMTPEVIASTKPAAGEKHQLANLGLTVQTLTADIAQRFGIEAEKGVLITAVDDGSLAAMSGLQPGDVIVEADHKPVATAQELQSIIDKQKNDILLLIKRKDANIFVVFRLR